MDPIPVLNGEKIFLARLRREDVPEIARFYSNLELTTYIRCYGRAYSFKDEEAWYEGIKKSRPDFVFFGIYEVSSNRILGGVDLGDIDHRHGAATLGVSIHDPEVWGLG